MCMPQAALVGLGRWNWDGDRIVHDCVVPSSRPVVGRTGRKALYRIDVREFLVDEHNAVMSDTLRRELPPFIEKVGGNVERFRGREPGAFDYRVAMLEAFIGETVWYVPTEGADPWQFPDETLHIREGDCEDRALLLAALLLSSGVSSYNVRIALGKLRIHATGQRRLDHDHVWVMYKTEAGLWTVIEPLRKVKTKGIQRSPKASPSESDPFGWTSYDAEYIPYYLFNDNHLWEVGSDRKPSFGEATLRRRWKRITPRFAGDAHKSIMTAALAKTAPQWVIDEINRQFTSLFGQAIDAPDFFPTKGYDSLDHFDNGFIQEGWGRVNERLLRFKNNNRAYISDFTWAAHAIADFYAHSSYPHFARMEGGYPVAFDPKEPDSCCARRPTYRAGSSFDLASGRFSTHSEWKQGPAAAALAWDGKIISGRYALRGDSKSLIERLTPTPAYLEKPGARMALPHHDEIAVDGPKPASGHKLYQSNPNNLPLDYGTQFTKRRLAAIRHIRQAYQQSATDSIRG